MLDVYLAVLGGLAVALGLSSRQVRQLPLSEPLVALAVGVLIGPGVLGIVDIPSAHRFTVLATASEVVVAIAVMAVALRFTLAEIRAEAGTLLLLLTAVLVGMALISAGLGALVLGAPAAAAWLLGAAVAPTDPVLASSIVSGEPAERQLPGRLRVLISVESAANDGLAFAFVGLGMAAVAGTSLAATAGQAAVQLVASVVAGAGIGLAVGRLVLYAERHRDMEHSAFLVLTLSLTVFVLGAVNALGGQGVLAVFVAGLAYDHEVSRGERAEEWEVQEAINRYLVLPVFTLLGVALPWQAWAGLGWQAPAFAAAVLALRRPPLVLAASRALRLAGPEARFVGWFGPVGIAALFYLSTAGEHGLVDERTWGAGTLVIAASTVLHGITATAGRRRLAHRLEATGRG